MRSRRGLVALVLVPSLLAGGCQLDSPAATRATTTLSELPDDLTDADEEAELDGHRFRIEARVWRNLQPNAAGGGIPACANLCAEISVVPLDEVALDPVVVPDAWAVTPDGGRQFDHLRVRDSGEALEVTASRGPWLDTGAEVFVVVRLSEREGGDQVLIRSPDLQVENVN